MGKIEGSVLISTEFPPDQRIAWHRNWDCRGLQPRTPTNSSITTKNGSHSSRFQQLGFFNKMLGELWIVRGIYQKMVKLKFCANEQQWRIGLGVSQFPRTQSRITWRLISCAGWTLHSIEHIMIWLALWDCYTPTFVHYIYISRPSSGFNQPMFSKHESKAPKPGKIKPNWNPYLV